MSDAPAAEKPETKLWEIPSIDGTPGQGYLTASRLQELQNLAYDEAFQEGSAAGQKAGEDAVKERAARFDKLLIALTKPLEILDETVESQLVELAMTVARQLFRREIQSDPSHVIGVVKEAIQLLPIACRNIELHLHPDDASMVREYLSSDGGERAWTIVEDALVDRGGCIVTSENSQIDAQAETRMQAIVEAICGDERR